MHSRTKILNQISTIIQILIQIPSRDIQQNLNNNNNHLKTKYLTLKFVTIVKKEGHLVFDCWKLKKKEQGQENSKPTGFVSSKNLKLCNDARNDTFSEVDKTISEGNAYSNSVMEIFEPFIHDGFVSIKNDLYNATPIKIIRDTGSSQSIIDGYFAIFG